MSDQTSLSNVNPGTSLITPTPDVVRKYIWLFEQNDYAANTDKAIRHLVDAFPENVQIDEVLLKVTAINRLYSTNLYAVYPMAQHIVKLDIDTRIKEHDPEIVAEIANLQVGEKRRCFYSFATKYCSWHAQTGYPIYDSFVDQLLRFYRQRDGFAKFTNAELWHYPTFRSVIQAFQRHYGLTEFSFKEIDKFLWIYGQEYNNQKRD